MQLGRFLSWPRHGIDYGEYLRLRRLPPQTPTITRLYGRPLAILDAISFLSLVDQIFNRRVYATRMSGPAPLVIDGGANIGLSVLYFKRLYPHCRVIAFEPDPAAFAALRYNVESFALKAVELHERALWTAATELDFSAFCDLSGRVVAPQTANTTTVQAVRLRDWLHEPVALLKLDIEGAETAVVVDCADRLGLDEPAFIEYPSFANAPQSLHRLLTTLSEASLRYQIREEYGAPAPLIEQPTRLGMDMQLDIYAYRPKEVTPYAP